MNYKSEATPRRYCNIGKIKTFTLNKWSNLNTAELYLKTSEAAVNTYGWSKDVDDPIYPYLEAFTFLYL